MLINTLIAMVMIGLFVGLVAFLWWIYTLIPDALEELKEATSRIKRAKAIREAADQGLIVLCKDCKHARQITWYGHYDDRYRCDYMCYDHEPNNYCNRGEKKDV